jgi:DNA mismatch repair ATPase MutL
MPVAFTDSPSGYQNVRSEAPVVSEGRNDFKPEKQKFEQFTIDETNNTPRIEGYSRQYDFERKTPKAEAMPWHEPAKQELNEIPSPQTAHKLNISVIGQLFGTYILGQQEDTFYLIDQHAAHERIMFEYIKEKYNTKEIPMQDLMLPIIIELSPAEKLLYTENSLIFQNLGFEIEWFGENTLAIRAIPIIMGEPCTGEFFSNILDSVKDPSNPTASPLEKIIISMACKNAIKAGDSITPEETAELINRLMKTNQPYTCPHGRPTIITMSRYELEKKFKRII